MSKHYRVREGSLIDLVRYGIAGGSFWAIIIWAIVTTY